MIEMECVCGDTWVSGKLGTCLDCGTVAVLAPGGESDWVPCLACWLSAHDHSQEKS